MKVYSHGVSGGIVIVVSGTISPRQKLKDFRKELLRKASEEIHGDNPYRDGIEPIKTLNKTYDRNLTPFVPDSRQDSVWMRNQDCIFDEEKKAQEYVEERNKKLFNDLRDMMQVDIMPTDSEFQSLKYCITDGEN